MRGPLTCSCGTLVERRGTRGPWPRWCLVCKRARDVQRVLAQHRANREQWKAYRRRDYAANVERERGRDRLRQPHRSQRKRERMERDPVFRLACHLRARLANAVRGRWKGSSAVRDLGCSLDEFVRYIQARFAPGMSWENYGAWHLDHIQPLASFDLTDRTQCAAACHYSNLQPLWAADNVRKGARRAA